MSEGVRIAAAVYLAALTIAVLFLALSLLAHLWRERLTRRRADPAAEQAQDAEELLAELCDSHAARWYLAELNDAELNAEAES